MRARIGSVWAHLPFVLLIAILPLAILSAVWLTSHRVQTEEAVRLAHAATVRTLAAVQGRRTLERTLTVEALARRIEDERLYLRPRNLQRALDGLRPVLGVVALSVLDLEGRAIAFSPPVGPTGEPTTGVSYADRAYFRDAVARNATVVSSLLVGRQTQRPIQAFITPVRAGAQVVAFAGMAVELSAVTEAMQTHAPGLVGRLSCWTARAMPSTSTRAAASPSWSRGAGHRWPPSSARGLARTASLWRAGTLS